MINPDINSILNGDQVLAVTEAFSLGLEDSRRRKEYRPPSLDPDDARAVAYQMGWELYVGVSCMEYHVAKVLDKVLEPK